MYISHPFLDTEESVKKSVQEITDITEDQDQDHVNVTADTTERETETEIEIETETGTEIGTESEDTKRKEENMLVKHSFTCTCSACLQYLWACFYGTLLNWRLKIW